MAKYTVELRALVTAQFDLEMDEYPIFSESYRAGLNQKILDHYAFREIGFDTAARFRHYLKFTMNEIMPYYNKLYESEALQTLSLIDTDFKEELNRQMTGSSTTVNAGQADSTETDDNLNVNSVTPQALVSAADIKGNMYASEADRQDNTRTATRQSSAQSSGAVNNLDTFVRRIYGNRMSDDKDQLIKLRKTFINIDMMVIQELDSLFMRVY